MSAEHLNALTRLASIAVDMAVPGRQPQGIMPVKSRVTSPFFPRVFDTFHKDWGNVTAGKPLERDGVRISSSKGLVCLLHRKGVTGHARCVPGPRLPEIKSKIPQSTFFACGSMSSAIPSGTLCRPALPGLVGIKDLLYFRFDAGRVFPFDGAL